MKKEMWNWLLVWIGCFLGVAGCGAKGANGVVVGEAEKVFSYNLQAPEIIELPEILNEISGLTYSSDNGKVYAIHDESGDLFQIEVKPNPVVQQWSIGKKDDYEDLAIQNQTVYVLSSKGKLVYFPLTFPIQNPEKVTADIKGKNEFEILVNDQKNEQLWMICKECKGHKDETPVFRFHTKSKSFDPDPVAFIRQSDIEKKLGEKIGRFKPSAASLHPQTGELYIISSINQVMVVTDKQFKVKNVVKFNSSLFKQPEGLCFRPDGTLLISNEAAGKGAANILVFKPQD